MENEFQLIHLIALVTVTGTGTVSMLVGIRQARKDGRNGEVRDAGDAVETGEGEFLIQGGVEDSVRR